MRPSSFSICHLAEIMDDDWVMAKHIGAKREYLLKCSYCGKVCQPLQVSVGVPHDLELTIRRWKDGDCSTDDMFNKICATIGGYQNDVIRPLRESLQTGEPAYEFHLETLRWVETAALKGTKT